MGARLSTLRCTLALLALGVACEPKPDPSAAASGGQAQAAPKAEAKAGAEAKAEPASPPAWDFAWVGELPEPSCAPKECVAAGLERYDEVLGAEDDLQVRREAYMMQRKACAAGVAAGCYEQAMLLASGLPSGDEDPEQRKARQVELFEHACTEGWGRACYRRGEDHHGTPQAHEWYARAIELYTPACEGGDAAQCSLLAYSIQLGRGAPKDAQNAAQLYAKACRGKDAYGCEMHGLMITTPASRLYMDPPAAIRDFERACELGAPYYGCYQGGVRLARGRGLPADPDAGIELLRAGCAEGEAEGHSDARACTELEDLCREGFEAACN